MKKKEKLIFLSPAGSTKGGISTVIDLYRASALKDSFEIIIVETHCDGKYIRKIAFAFRAWLYITIISNIYRRAIVHVNIGDFPSPIRKAMITLFVPNLKLRGVLHNHGAFLVDQFDRMSFVKKGLVKLFFQRFNKVICLSELVFDQLNSRMPLKDLIVLPNGVRIPSPRKIERDSSANKLLFLGNIGPRKGLFDLLRASAILADMNYKIRLVIGGNGDEIRLRNEIVCCNVGEIVEFLGWVDTAKRRSLFETSDVFILPSYAEGMPMSILEAMSFGIPIVSTKVGGIPEVIADGVDGFLIEPGDVHALASAISKLCDSSELARAMGENARKKIEDRFNIDIQISRLNAIYNELNS